MSDLTDDHITHALSHARAIIICTERWTRDAVARDTGYEKVLPTDRTAASFSVRGGINYALWKLGRAGDVGGNDESIVMRAFVATFFPMMSQRSVDHIQGGSSADLARLINEWNDNTDHLKICTQLQYAIRVRRGLIVPR